MRPCFWLLGPVTLVAIAACGGQDSSPSNGATSSATAGTGGSGQGGGGMGGAGSMEVAAVCAAYCDCTACTPVARAGCASLWDNNHASAMKKGCVDQYQALLDCVNKTSMCSAGKPVDQCDTQRAAFMTCIM